MNKTTNYLKQLHNFNSKHQKGLSPFIKHDAGDVPTAQSVMNSGMTLSEDIDYDKLIYGCTISLDYSFYVDVPLQDLLDDLGYDLTDIPGYTEDEDRLRAELIDKIVENFNADATFYNEQTKEQIEFDLSDQDYDDSCLYFYLSTSDLVSEQQVLDACVYALKDVKAIREELSSEVPGRKRAEDDWDDYDINYTMIIDVDRYSATIVESDYVE